MIKLITMQNKESAAVCQLVIKLFRNFYHPALLDKSQDHRASQKIIVVADCQADACSTFGQIHQAGHNLIAFGMPMPATLQTPAVNEVANKVKILRFMSIEKLQERLNP